MSGNCLFGFAQTKWDCCWLVSILILLVFALGTWYYSMCPYTLSEDKETTQKNAKFGDYAMPVEVFCVRYESFLVSIITIRLWITSPYYCYSTDIVTPYISDTECNDNHRYTVFISIPTSSAISCCTCVANLLNFVLGLLMIYCAMTCCMLILDDEISTFCHCCQKWWPP